MSLYEHTRHTAPFSLNKFFIMSCENILVTLVKVSTKDKKFALVLSLGTQWCSGTPSVAIHADSAFSTPADHILLVIILFHNRLGDYINGN